MFLNDTGGLEELPSEITNWVTLISDPVVMKDNLAISCALDYDRQGGSPAKAQTEIGKLRSVAKPYGGQQATRDTELAASKLSKCCVEFLKQLTCYESADCVVAMPPSDPSKTYNLPRYLAENIAAEWGRDNLTPHVRTIKPRGSIKGIALANKFDTLSGTIEVDCDIFNGKRVLLVDDLYQSGISMNYCALLLLQAGASKVFGLACEKTCRNDDNVTGKR